MVLILCRSARRRNPRRRSSSPPDSAIDQKLELALSRHLEPEKRSHLRNLSSVAQAAVAGTYAEISWTKNAATYFHGSKNQGRA